MRAGGELEWYLVAQWFVVEEKWVAVSVGAPPHPQTGPLWLLLCFPALSWQWFQAQVV